jgi:hypothetical protein
VTPSEVALWVGVPVGLPFVGIGVGIALAHGPEAWREIRAWLRRRYNPRGVALVPEPGEDEAQWLTTLPIAHLRRLADSLNRMERRGRLHGENITRLRAVRLELRRRLKASESPNRAPMDFMSDADRGFIRQHLRRKAS